VPPHPNPNPQVPEERRHGKDHERRVAPQQPRPQRQQPAELVDEAGDSEGLEGEASQHVEGVAEQEEPEAGEDPGEILPDEHRGEEEGDEGKVALEAEHPGGQGAPSRLLPAADVQDLDRSAEEDYSRPGEEDS